jgi:hypothetical protein
MAKSGRKITKADLGAAANLKKIWIQKKNILGLTQQSVAEVWPGTQGLIGQYLNGQTALGPVAILKWCRVLNIHPTDIRPDFQYTDLVIGDLSPEAIEVAVKWQSLPSHVAADFKRSLDQMEEQAAKVYNTFLSNLPKTPQKEPR